MSNFRNILLLCGAAFAAWHLGLKYLYASGQFAFKVNKIRLVPTNGGVMQVQLYLLVRNQSSVSVFFNGMDGELSLNGTVFGNFSNPVNRHIIGNGVTEMALAINVSSEELIAKIWNDMKSTLIQHWSIGIRGTVVVQNKHLPLDIMLTAQDIENMYGK